MLLLEEVKRGQSGSPFLAEDNAVGQAGQALRQEANENRASALSRSLYWTAATLLQTAQSRLISLARLKGNWDSYGAPPPNQTALDNAVRILEHMKLFDLTIANIVPSAEGGVGFCFAQADRYADIESSNDGDIIGVKYVGMETPEVIETDGTDASIESALQRIRDHISV